jgi:malate dehydrogenase
MVSGVPVMIGAGGGEQIIEMTLKTLQKPRFKDSVGSVKEMVDALYENGFFDDLKDKKS